MKKILLLCLLLVGCSSALVCDDGREVADLGECVVDEPEVATDPKDAGGPLIEQVNSTGQVVYTEEDILRVFDVYREERAYDFRSYELFKHENGLDHYKVIYRNNELNVTSIMYIDSAGGVYEHYLIP